jgi:hypothetical protein
MRKDMDRIDKFLKSLLYKTKEERDLLREKEHICPSEETVVCYIDNLLKDDEKESFEEHLAECDNCLQQTIMLHGFKKEVEESGYMEAPAELTQQAKNLVQEEIIQEEPVPAGSMVPESSEKSLTNVIFEFISNTIRARSGYRFVSYGAPALIVMLSIYIGMPAYKLATSTLSMKIIPYDYSEDRTRSGSSEGKRKNADGSVSEVKIEEGSVLQSNDKFQVQFETKEDAYVYIIIHDSLNKAKQLFPDPSEITFSNKVKANSSHTVPTLGWRLDENVGKETIYVLASKNPLDNIKDLLRAMEDVKEPENKLNKFAKDNDAVVRDFSFRHIDRQ